MRVTHYTVFYPAAMVIVLALATMPLSAQPRVAASIRPLQHIAQAVTAGVSTPEVILSGVVDPHHISLKPSQRRALDEADVLLWVGPDLEAGLADVVTGLEHEVITLMELPGMSRLMVKDRPDPHLWLDSRNAGLVAGALTQRLVILDPGNADRYRSNLANFETGLSDLELQIAGMFAGGNNPTFAVYHNAFRYFEQQFGLAHRASFTDNEELQPGVRKILNVKAVLARDAVHCILVGPAVNTDHLQNMIEVETIHYAVIDVLANDIVPAADSYLRFMRSLAETIAACGNG